MKVIKFSATWCGPCRVYASIFDKVSKMNEFKDVKFSEIDVEENPEMAEKYKIRNVPCTLIITDSDTVRLAGLQTEENLCNEIRKLL